MNRHDSARLRHLVDEAVGPHYDALFLRLDLLATSREGRCGCADCRATVRSRRAAVVAALPPLGV